MDIKNYIKSSIDTKNKILNDEKMLETIEKIVRVIISAFKNNKQGILSITDFLNTNISQGDGIITWTKINNLSSYLGKEVVILDIKSDFSEPTEKELVSSNVINPRMI